MKLNQRSAAYEAPALCRFDFSIERGFALSGPSDFIDPDFDGRTEE